MAIKGFKSDVDKQYYNRIRGDNNEVLATSEGLETKEGQDTNRQAIHKAVVADILDEGGKDLLDQIAAEVG